MLQQKELQKLTAIMMASPAFATPKLVTMRRRTDFTSASVQSSSPEAKRRKSFNEEAKVQNELAARIVQHPVNVPVPSEASIKALFEAALQTYGSNSDNICTSDQEYLRPAGILSLEQVLLPAIALEEEKALKKVQSKVQRDVPQYRSAMEQTRRLVRQSILAAMQAVSESRTIRCQKQEERREQDAKERRIERQARALIKAQEHERYMELREKERQEKAAKVKQMLKKKLPKNQELWKEVIVLTSSITQLEKEERLWLQADKALMRSQELNDSDDSEQLTKEVVVQAQKDPLQRVTENSMQDIVIASTRIQQSLSLVRDVIEESEQVRKELYQKYRKDHQFHGYQGAKNAAGLIRFLSQEQ